MQEKIRNILIINADDFGYSHDVNMAIVDAFKKGLITNTTIMVNMPAYEEAILLAEQYGFKNCVGLHLNLYEGKPLTNQMKECHILFENGEMTSKKILDKKNIIKKFILSKSEKTAILCETNAQIEKFQRDGFTQKHIDSHGHAHTINSIWTVIEESLKTNGFVSVRKSLNLYSIKRSGLIKLYKYIFNNRLVKEGFKSTEYFTSSVEFLDSSKNLVDSTCEVMVHPVYKNGKIINKGGYELEKILVKRDDFLLRSFSIFEKQSDR